MQILELFEVWAKLPTCINDEMTPIDYWINQTSSRRYEYHTDFTTNGQWLCWLLLLLLYPIHCSQLCSQVRSMCTKVYLPVRIRCGMQCFYRFLVGNCITHPGVHKHCKQTPISRCDAMHGARSHCELSTTIATALVVTGLRKAFRYHSWSSIFRSGSREHRGL